MKGTVKVAAVLGVASAIATMAASPALAVSGVLLPTLGSGSNGPHHVNGQCIPDAGVATNLDRITYVLSADASAYATNGAEPVGTSLQCFAYNTATNHVYGSISNGLTGPAAVAVGVVTVWSSANVALCVKATALFNDNQTATFNSCPF